MLSDKHCVPCEGGAKPLSGDKLDEYLKQVKDWETLDSSRKITKHFEFKDFKEAMDFIGKVADIAESEGHHPDIHIFYNKVQLVLWTHAINGLSENDFILASKIDVATILKNQ
ncbi:MAG: 4a-hydroxytetrahydrobiopterin dehydratase [bacterium]|nr:4a-hydroxytetrahydrobiopterin dehydratase [bacterium]